MVTSLQLDQIASDPKSLYLLRMIQSIAQQQDAGVYLVGGTIRDALLERMPDDWDFAVQGDVLTLSRQCAETFSATLVVLDEEHLPTVRLVRKSQPWMLDFAQLRATTLEEDLKARDLTINAMAVDLGVLLATGTAPLTDPCGGLVDFDQQQLRFTSEASVHEDPLRLLRAYRFAATLGWTLHESVSELVSRVHSEIQQVAIERIRDEFCKLLDVPIATPVLRKMDQDGLLAEIIPEIEQMKGVSQNTYHHLDVWEHTLLAMEIAETQPIPSSLLPYRKQIRDYLRMKVVYDKRKRMLLRLALLLHDVAKPATRTVTPTGTVRFIAHEKIGADIAKGICDRLRLGGKAKNLVGKLVYNHLRMMYFAKLGEPSPRAIRRFIRHTGDDWLGILLLSHADLYASQGAARNEEDCEVTLRIMRLIADTYYEELEPIVHAPRLITGDDLLAMFDKPPGRWVGQTLKRIEDMQFNGEIKTREEALNAARAYIREQGLLS